MTNGNILLLTCEFCGDYYYTLEAFSVHVQEHLSVPQNRIKREASIDCGIDTNNDPLQIYGTIKDNPKQQDERHLLVTTAESEYLLNIKREDSISFCSENESTLKPLADLEVTTLQGDTESLLCISSANKNKKSKCHANRSISAKKHHVNPVPPATRNYVHKCSFCDLRFAGKQKLIDHENTHTGKQPYQCKFCPKTFAAASSLWSHNKLHSDERLHSCSVCGIKFAHKHMRDRHHREHHLPDSDPLRYFGCTLCDRKFKTHRQMCYHRAIHKRKTETFTCDHCQRQFNSRSTIVDHMQKIHEGKKETMKKPNRKTTPLNAI